MSPLPVPERIEGTGSVPRGVEFCVASFGKETPTGLSFIIASIRRIDSYDDFYINPMSARRQGFLFGQSPWH